MIMNIKALAFSKLEEVSNIFQSIKDTYQKEGTKFKEFLVYFQKKRLEGKKNFKNEICKKYIDVIY